jgi:hypothetical protein
MKFRKLLGIFFFFTLVTTSVFGFTAENSSQGFDRNSTDLHQGSTLSKAATAPGSLACFLGSSRQVFLLGQSGNGSVQTASDIVKKLIKEGKVNPKDLEVVANQIENALKRFGPAGSKPNSNSFNSLIRKNMEEAKARLGK